MFVFNHTGHKNLWNWIAEHPTHDETDYFDAIKLTNELRPKWNHYGCEFVEHIVELIPLRSFHNGFFTTRCADICPLDWGVGENGQNLLCCGRYNKTLYNEWSNLNLKFHQQKNTRDLRTLIGQIEKAARAIANLGLKRNLPYILHTK